MRLLWIATLALIATGVWAQEVYRSVDEQGNVIYSDRPQGRNPQQILVAAPRAGSPVRSTPTGPGASDATSPEEAPLMAETAREPSATELAEQRARNCEIARERLELALTSRRLYRTLPDGERQYLESEEIDEARASAAASVESWCN